MRTREEIGYNIESIHASTGGIGYSTDKNIPLILEVLLDIRDLLATPTHHEPE